MFFDFRNRSFKIEISLDVTLITSPPLPFSLVVLEQGFFFFFFFFFASHLRLVLTIKTFSTHSKANYNKLETQNGGGGGASFCESV